MIVGIPKETAAGERRVALVPDLVPKLARAGWDVVVETAAGEAAGFLDAAYAGAGAKMAPDAFGSADVVLKVQPPNADGGGRFKSDAVVIGFLQPYSNAEGIRAL